VKQLEETEYLSLASMWETQFFLKRNIPPEVAMAPTEEAMWAEEQERMRDERDTNRSLDEIDESKTQRDFEKRFIVAQMLTAARQLKRPELVEQLRPEITTPPTNKQLVWTYWLCRARLAILDGHNADALAYYQLTSQTDPVKPQMVRGKFWDVVGDETRTLWKEMGGTEEAWQAWRKQPITSEQATEGFLAKSNRPLPEFALADMTGKSWRLKDLAGRTTLITVWATWCGPCQAELPHVEKLYEMTKDRKDIQVVTFNMDENPGLVQPFLNENKYEFPVLLAHSFINSTLDEIGIPQNWIIDPKGQSVSIDTGFGFENGWEGKVVRRLEAVHKSSVDAVTLATQK
jgi:thiol-disulfide isomerase/thioredoxin